MDASGIEQDALCIDYEWTVHSKHVAEDLARIEEYQAEGGYRMTLAYDDWDASIFDQITLTRESAD